MRFPAPLSTLRLNFQDGCATVSEEGKVTVQIIRQQFILAAWVLAIAALTPGELAAGPERMALPERSITKGLFLIADPRLTDSNFRESVVLLTRHGPNGTIGVIINRPTAQPLSQFFDLPPREETAFLFVGGPVDQNAMSFIIQTEHPSPEMAPVLDGIYFSTDPRALAGLSKRPEPFRAYAGYAGWAPGQLAGEFRRGDWRLLPADPLILFHRHPETIWAEMFRRSQQRSVDLPSAVPSGFETVSIAPH